ncbi:hypothetical protein Ancab_013224 [Ancistrocladus abbreviatus]
MGKKRYIVPAGEAELLAAVSSVKKKTAGRSQKQSWMMFDSSGQSTTLDVDKYAIIRRVHINARDLRILEPNLSYPSAILGRDNAIVLNLEHNKRCIMHHFSYSRTKGSVLRQKSILLGWFHRHPPPRKGVHPQTVQNIIH